MFTTPAAGRRLSTRPTLAGALLALAGGLAAAFALPASGAEATSPGRVVVVHADGSIATQTEGGATLGATRTPQSVRYHFGLPNQTPIERGLEEGALPIGRTRWEQDGIRYTQIVLVTRLGAGDLPPAGAGAADAVLMVQLVGENGTNDYMEAKAELSVEIGGRKRNLELREGVVRLAETDATGLVALIEVSTSGIVGTKGPQLRFGGNMPPGTSGAMTLKFPLAALDESRDLERLRDLEFDEQLRRVKQFWTGRAKPAAPPVILSNQKP